VLPVAHPPGDAVDRHLDDLARHGFSLRLWRVERARCTILTVPESAFPD
jgi:hypothetical protein